MFRVVVGRRGRVGPLFTIAVKLADAMGRYDVGAAVLVLSKVDLVLLLSEKSFELRQRLSSLGWNEADVPYTDRRNVSPRM